MDGPELFIAAYEKADEKTRAFMRAIAPDIFSSPEPAKPLTLCQIPVRLDGTLCDQDEIWIEEPTGEAKRIY